MNNFLEDLDDVDLGISFDHREYQGEEISFKCMFRTYVSCTFKNMKFINVDFGGTTFKECTFDCCKFVGCIFEGTHFSSVQFKSGFIRDSYLRLANLFRCSMYGFSVLNCDLSFATISHGYFYDTKIQSTNFYGAKLKESEAEDCIFASSCCNIRMACPEEGSFIGYKVTDECLVKLKILENAKRSSATSRKCRCSSALVLSIEDIKTNESRSKTRSSYSSKFVYEVGKIVEVNDFDENRWNECAAGIHFFLTKGEALQFHLETTLARERRMNVLMRINGERKTREERKE